ncbi:response regulator transcription factor [Streptomyces sp. NPDC004549]|uniref:helix-turn-helix transcriptional regulator n=1 Tax=Streptomyces sp. NPDC004549 TaxID=3154283 RepID=UPI0033B6335A
MHLPLAPLLPTEHGRALRDIPETPVADHAPGGPITSKNVRLFTTHRVDRSFHDALRSHYGRHPDVAVVLLADRIGAHDIVAVAPFGVAAVVRSAELHDDPGLLKRAMTLAADGGHRLPRGMGRSLRTAAVAPTRQQTLGQPGSLLTPSEIDVLLLVAEGLTGTGIARQLGRSPQSVQSTLKNIFERLGVQRRAEAVAYAAREGPLPDPADQEAR